MILCSLHFLSELAEAVAFEELIFLAPPTPELEDGGADLSYVLRAIGTVLFLVGGSSFVIDIRKRNVRKHLKLHGTKIEADIQSAEINTTFSVNGRNPYRVICQWENPSTSKVHVFTSENIWFDPNDYIKSDKITVLIDKRSPKKHIVDLSFLPEIG